MELRPATIPATAPVHRKRAMFALPDLSPGEDRRHGKRPVLERFEFCRAFCHFRMAAIVQGARDARDRNASTPEYGLQPGADTPQFARQGLEITNR
ncbi:hypothetical protein [Roseovarius pacificus]|uniref:hypothetical protein n=1 Tax=Roseovarius pacificus TaxID=337701 RepID=UPI001356574C|nr:hypothetical protein [Roseovarius pacificus]